MFWILMYKIFGVDGPEKKKNKDIGKREKNGEETAEKRGKW